MKERQIDKIIKEICDENGIELSSFSHNWIYKLKKDNINRYIIGYNFDVNTSGVYQIASDKSATYQILNSSNIPCIPHILFLKPSYFSLGDDYSIFENMMKVFSDYNFNVVVKKNDGGTGGNDVYRVNNKTKLEEIVLKLFQNNKSICLSPFIDNATEYRCIILNNSIKLIYKKNRQSVIGNGKLKLKELIFEKYTDNIKNIISNLNVENISLLNTIIEDGKEIILNWKHNLGLGSKPEIIYSSDKYNALEELAINTSKELNISFASIDIIESNNVLYVLEVNSGIMMENFIYNVENGYEIAKNVYKEAIELMFK